jgi:hypothetical protein
MRLIRHRDIPLAPHLRRQRIVVNKLIFAGVDAKIRSSANNFTDSNE